MVNGYPRPVGRRARASEGSAVGLVALVRSSFSDVRLVVATGLILTYIWRFHDLSPILRPFRFAAIFTVLSWGFLLIFPNFSTLGRALKKPYVIAFLLWASWILISAPLGIFPENSVGFFLGTESKNVLFLLFLVSTISTPKRFKVVFLSNIAGASVAALFYIKGGMPAWGSPLPMYDVNDMALLLNMTLPFAIWAAITFDKKRDRTFFWVVTLCSVFAVIGTESRGGLLTLASVIGFLLYRIRGVSKSATLALALGVGVLMVAAPGSYWERMSTILTPSEDYNVTSYSGRIEIWKRGLELARQYPIAGVGSRNFSIAEVQLRPDANLLEKSRGGQVAHNSFLEVLAETGFVGFFLWMGMLGAFYFRLRALRKRLLARDPKTHQVLVRSVDALMASLLAYCVGGFFLAQGYFPFLLVIVALGAGLEEVVDREQRNARSGTGRGPRLNGQRVRPFQGPGHLGDEMQVDSR